MNGLNGIIIDGKVYELSVDTYPDACECCALANGDRCDAPHWLNCNNIVLSHSQSLTNKLKEK